MVIYFIGLRRITCLAFTFFLSFCYSYQLFLLQAAHLLKAYHGELKDPARIRGTVTGRKNLVEGDMENWLLPKTIQMMGEGLSLE